LTLDELYQAFGSVWSLSETDPPLKLVGFDTCLMATVDVAYTFSDIAKYLVASEETEPENGWYYSEWVGTLAENPSMDGAAWARSSATHTPVPVLLNGEEYNLQVVYDFSTEKWSILGARQDIDNNGMADKNLRLLQEGDIIDTIWYAASYSGDDDFEAYTVDTLTVTANTAFDEIDLPDGSDIPPQSTQIKFLIVLGSPD
jgi:hypothetical protein